MTKKFMLVIVLMTCAVVALGVPGNASEILFEDNFDGDSLGDHWEIVLRENSISSGYNAESPAEYEVKDGKLVIDAPVGDTYFDLKGYELTGDFTIEVKFNFSSERSESPGNFMIMFHRPEDYISWWDSEGVGVSVRRWDSISSVISDRIITELDLWEALWGSDMYDTEHVLKVKAEAGMLYLQLDDVDILAPFFEPGVAIDEYMHGGFSFSVYDSIVSFDYIKVYR